MVNRSFLFFLVFSACGSGSGVGLVVSGTWLSCSGTRQAPSIVPVWASDGAHSCFIGLACIHILATQGASSSCVIFKNYPRVILAPGPGFMSAAWARVSRETSARRVFCLLW